MRKNRGADRPRRSEITEKIDKGKDEMSEKTEHLDTVAADTETVMETLDSLDLAGTADAIEQIEGAIEEARDVTHEVFEREDDDLNEMLTDVQEHEDELQERSDASESDLQEISEATDKIATDETTRGLEHAQAKIQDDIEFLQEQRDSARESREESERLRQEYQQRMQGGRR
jgi:ABC-type transporter Mla subunit MlaD